MMEILHAAHIDIPEILQIYDNARLHMRANGNTSQWSDGYPAQADVEQDINNNQLFLCIENSSIVGVFAFIIGEDPFYANIENGSWRANCRYGTIHRIASSGKIPNIFKSSCNFALNKIKYLRADTHKDNKQMQNALVRFGFKHCGTVYVRNKSPRLAFDYIAH